MSHESRLLKLEDEMSTVIKVCTKLTGLYDKLEEVYESMVKALDEAFESIGEACDDLNGRTNNLEETASQLITMTILTSDATPKDVKLSTMKVIVEGGSLEEVAKHLTKEIESLARKFKNADTLTNMKDLN